MPETLKLHFNFENLETQEPRATAQKADMWGSSPTNPGTQCSTQKPGAQSKKHGETGTQG